jgi:PEGA domain
MRARPALSLAFAVGWLATTAGGTIKVARAAAASEDDAAIRRGVELRRQGKDQDALEEFRKAYAAAKTPRALAQIGLAEQALGRWADAEFDLDQAVASKSDPWISKNAVTLTGALDAIRWHLGSLDVIGPDGAELRVDGRAVGTLPLAKPVRVAIGNLTVEVRKPGFFPATRPVSIAAGELTRESIDLQPVAPVAVVVPAAHAGARGPESASPAMAGASAGDNPVTAPSGPLHAGADLGAGQAGDAEGGGAAGGWQRTLAWTAAVGALLGGAVGAGALLLRDGNIKNANDLTCNVDSGGSVMPLHENDRPRCIDLVNTASSDKLAAEISFAAAGALAIGAVVLFATAPSPRAPPPSHHLASTAGLACAPTLATTGVACHFRF